MSHAEAFSSIGRRLHRFGTVLVLALALAGCTKTELYTGLEEREANEILSLMLSHGIEAEKVLGKGNLATVSVETSKIPQAMGLLSAAGLPRERFVSMGDVFKKEGMISSPAEERARYIHSISQELSKTLTQIGGVLTARVHIVLPENDLLNHSTAPASAAVLIRHTPTAAIDTIVPKIKELVMNSLEGLSYDHVSVILVRADQDEMPAVPAPVSTAAITDAPWLFPALGLGIVASLVANAALGVVAWRRRRG